MNKPIIFEKNAKYPAMYIYKYVNIYTYVFIRIYKFIYIHISIYN